WQRPLMREAPAHRSEIATHKLAICLPAPKDQEVTFSRFHAQSFRGRLAHLHVRLVPVTTDHICCLDTELLPTVPSRESQGRIDVFKSTLADGIASCNTMPLMAIRELAGQQAHADQRKVIADAAGGAAIAGAGDLLSAVLRFATIVLMTNLVSQAN